MPKPCLLKKTSQPIINKAYKKILGTKYSVYANKPKINPAQTVDQAGDVPLALWPKKAEAARRSAFDR